MFKYSFELKMITASHYVIRDVLRMVESGDLEELHKMCGRYGALYKYDTEFKDILCNKIPEYMESKNSKKLGEIKSRLKELINVRKLRTSGGSMLWYKTRRP